MIADETLRYAVRTLASKTADAAVLDNIFTHWLRLPDYGVDTPLRAAHFLAQTAHESGGFKIGVENLRYSSAERLCRIWPKRFPDTEAAAPYLNAPEKLANKVYADRMGNGPPESGDGFRYRGRGLIQLTGKAAYEAVGDIVGLDLATTPDLAADPANALLVACGAWKHLRLDQLEETAPVELYTRRINGGLIGIEERKRLFAQTRTLLNIPDHSPE